MTTTDSTGSIPDTGRFAAVNGLDLYYEVHGEGRPLVLLHGGLGSGEMFVPVLPAFADGHQVILPDLQGHGRTADIDRPLDVRLMADDVAALVDHLGLGPVDVVGFSLGGGVALQTAVRHPDKVQKLYTIYKAAIEWVQKNPEQAAPLLAKGAPEAELKAIAAMIKSNERLAMKLTKSSEVRKDIEMVYKAGMDIGYLPSMPSAASIYDKPLR